MADGAGEYITSIAIGPGGGAGSQADPYRWPTADNLYLGIYFFTPNTAVTPAGSGTLSCGTPASWGDPSSCTATPAAGYALAQISGCGGTASSTSPYTTGPMTAACTVTASFTATPAITPSTAVSPANSGTLTCSTPAALGDPSSCTAVPAAGYALAQISGCGGTASSTSPYATGPMNAACTVTASFSATPVAATPVPVPSLGEWAMVLLGAALAALGWQRVRKAAA